MIARESAASKLALQRIEFDQLQSTDVLRVRITSEIKVVDTGTQEVRWPTTGVGTGK